MCVVCHTLTKHAPTSLCKSFVAGLIMTHNLWRGTRGAVGYNKQTINSSTGIEDRTHLSCSIFPFKKQSPFLHPQTTHTWTHTHTHFLPPCPRSKSRNQTDFSDPDTFGRYLCVWSTQASQRLQQKYILKSGLQVVSVPVTMSRSLCPKIIDL